MGQKIWEKRAAESLTVSLDLAKPLGAETIASVTSTVDTGLTKAGDPTSSGTTVYQPVSGGTAGTYYLVTWTVTTNSAQTLLGVVIVRVVADAKPQAINTATALVTLEETKSYIGKVTDEDTAVIEQLINSVSAKFNERVGVTLAQTTYTNYYLDGNGQRDLWLPFWPVTTLTSVYEDDELLTEGADYDFYLYSSNRGAYLRKIEGVWLKGAKTIKITCVAGFVCLSGTLTLPQDIRLSALKQIAFEFGRYMRKDEGLDSITYPDGSTSRQQTGYLLKDVEETLASYALRGLR